ncbi:MAG: response regulator [Magnetococcales bacterium]|nr:response regulator [Magnetococcales bacterium]
MNNAKILVVDDDAELRQELVTILQTKGFATHEAGTCQQAILLTQTKSFDLVLMDFLLPDSDMDGIDAIREIRKQDKQVKFIMITAFGTIENAVSAMKKGASEYITKPFKIEELLTTINRTLAESHFEQSIRGHDMQNIIHSLANPIRRGVIQALGEKANLRLMDLARIVGIHDHTKVMFHLRTLKSTGDIIQGADRTYQLTKQGQHTLNCLKTLHKVS